jgi:S-adenosylmethionine hydrolase
VSGAPRRPGDAGAIFFLTDYGQLDELAGVVRAVLARLAPGAPVIDLTHDIAPFDVRAGALALERAAPHLGPGVALGVVDPGVGTSRRAVALEVAGAGAGGPSFLVGPDNGLLVWAAAVLGGVRAAVVLGSAADERRPRDAATTFDGRDVFAPAAAALWRGAALSDLGERVPPEDLVTLPAPRLEHLDGGIEAEVLWIDRFGNVQLAATAADGRAAGLVAGDALVLRTPSGLWPARFVRAFAELEPSGSATGPELGVLVDANGRLAVVCAEGSAATVLAVQPEEMVRVEAAKS